MKGISLAVVVVVVYTPESDHVEDRRSGRITG
jgi:hypothetical protein